MPCARFGTMSKPQNYGGGTHQSPFLSLPVLLLSHLLEPPPHTHAQHVITARFVRRGCDTCARADTSLEMVDEPLVGRSTSSKKKLCAGVTVFVFIVIVIALGAAYGTHTLGEGVVMDMRGGVAGR